MTQQRGYARKKISVETRKKKKKKKKKKKTKEQKENKEKKKKKPPNKTRKTHTKMTAGMSRGPILPRTSCGEKRFLTGTHIPGQLRGAM